MRNMFSQAAAVTLQICTFRAGPQDLPYSPALTRLVIAIAATVNYLQFRLTLPWFAAAAQAIVAVLVLYAFTATVLQMRQFQNRTQQTANALLLANSLLSVLLLPFLIPLLPVLEEVARNPEAQAELPVVPAFGMLVLSIWSLAIGASIFRQALETRVWVGLACSLGMAFLIYVIAGGVGVMLAQPG
jgi:hypothetical protein